MSVSVSALMLYDNTRLSEYKRCPRKFLFRHIFHLKPDGRETALVFGGAWHSAMDQFWAHATKLRKDELVKLMYAAWLEHWCGEGLPHPSDIDYEMEKELAPRTPGNALEMIVGYVDDRWSRISDFEVVDIERPFAVPLNPNDPNLFYIGKIDKIVRYRGKIQGLEHKTTTAYKKNGPFRTAFLDSFSPNAQVDGYIFALHMMFPGEVRGVWVDGALVHKTEQGFQFIPIERQLAQLDGWLWEVQEWIGLIETDKKRLADCKTTDPYLRAFPKNTNSCHDFNRSCPYIDLCKALPNPLKLAGNDPPLGFSREAWNPLEHVKGLEKVLQDGS